MTVSLDDPNAVAPTFHVWTSEALEWDDHRGSADTLPAFRNG